MELRKVPDPESFVIPPTAYVPNSPLPVLLYRNVLPQPVTLESCQEFVEKHGWTRKGPVWKAIARRHFHANTHECYGIIAGSSRVLMGVGTKDVAEEGGLGLRLTLNTGDMIVHPAGTAHSNLESSEDYGYVSFFPNGSPKWKSDDGSQPLDLSIVRQETMAVPIPEDPVEGGRGHLQPLWEDAMNRYQSQSEK